MTPYGTHCTSTKIVNAFVVFGNRTIGIHLLRGVLGLIALYASFSTISDTIWPSLILLLPRSFS